MKFEQGRREGSKGLKKHKERRTPKTAKRGEEASKGRKEKESGEEPAQPHVNPSVPALFSSVSRHHFVAISSTTTPSSGPPLDFDGQWWTRKLTYLVL